MQAAITEPKSAPRKIGSELGFCGVRLPAAKYVATAVSSEGEGKSGQEHSNVILIF